MCIERLPSVVLDKANALEYLSGKPNSLVGDDDSLHALSQHFSGKEKLEGEAEQQELCLE